MEKFDYQKINLLGDPQHSSVTAVLAHDEIEAWVVFGATGENAELFVNGTLRSLEKIPWFVPETLDNFLQNSLQLAARKNCQLTLALTLRTPEKNYFYTAGGSIILLRGRQSGRLLASDDYHILHGELLDDDQLILASSNETDLVNKLKTCLSESTAPAELLREKRDFLAGGQALGLLHFYPRVELVTATPAKKSPDAPHSTHQIPASPQQLLDSSRQFVSNGQSFVKRRKNWFILALFLLILAGLIAVLINYHHVGEALQENNQQNNPDYTALSADSALTDGTLPALGANPGDIALFYDLTLALPNFAPQKMIRAGETQLAFLDTTSKQALVLDLLNKSQHSLNLAVLPVTPRDFTFFNDQLVFLTNPLQAYNLTTQQWQSLSPSLDYLNTASNLASFGRNLYAIDGTKIHRLEYNADGVFQKEAPWLDDEVNLPASLVTSFTIDSSIYVSTFAGDFSKYQQGRRLNNFAKDLTLAGGPIYTYADSDNENLYILQPATSQIFITNEDGELEKTLSSDTYAQSTNLIALESQERLYVLVGHLIYFADLNLE